MDKPGMRSEQPYPGFRLADNQHVTHHGPNVLLVLYEFYRRALTDKAYLISRIPHLGGNGSIW